MSELGRVVQRFPTLRVLVVGDALLDVYLRGAAPRLCREAPVPLVRVEGREDVPGGAANAAANLRSLGAEVALVAPVGTDEEGERLRRGLAARGVVCELVADEGRRTPVLHRVVADGQLLVRFDDGTRDPLVAGSAAERALVDRLRDRWCWADAVVVSDYAAGALTPAVVDALVELRCRHPRTVVVDAEHVAAFRRLRPTAVKPNWSEARHLLAEPSCDDAGPRSELVARQGEQILELTGASVAAVTLDAEGALVFERGCAPHRTYAEPAPPAAATGAGDTFVSAVALALAAGARTPVAAELASAAASLVVRRPGTSVCTAGELARAVSGQAKVLSGPAELAAAVADHRARGRRLVFTNGCFDILHRGHILHLNRARQLGDVLVVAVNDDASVRALKGARRPVNPLDDRLRVLAALSCVDHLVPFPGASPTELLEAARPEVFAKGAGHRAEALPEAAVVERLGGRVVILPLEAGTSTTGIIERVRATAAPSA